MKQVTIRCKKATLKTYYKCLLYNPLGYEEYEKERIYYDLFMDALERGWSFYISINSNNQAKLYINGELQER